MYTNVLREHEIFKLAMMKIEIQIKIIRFLQGLVKSMSNYKYVNVKYFRYKTILIGLPQIFVVNLKWYIKSARSPLCELKKRGTWFSLCPYDCLPGSVPERCEAFKL